MAIDNLPTTTTTTIDDDESRLSGAYIHTLLNQLSSNSKPTYPTIVGHYPTTTTTTHPSQLTCHSTSTNNNMAKPKTQNNNNSNGHQGHKKQVRRRLHTSRPYQERLLNMAEARKEIVTALKFHRAAMKQATEQHKQQQQHQHQQQQQQRLDYQIPQQHSIIPKIESDTNNNTTMMGNLPYYPSSSYDNNNNYNTNNNNSYNNRPWGINSSLPMIEASLMHDDSLISSIPLPNQTLGLNLNLQAFANLDTNNFYHNNTTSSNFKYSLSSSSSSSSSSTSTTPTPRAQLAGIEISVPVEGVGVGVDMHSSLDEEEMAKIRSIGEQHQIEWDDTLDLVKSSWWLKVLKSVEFDEEIPPWLSANHDHNVQDYSSSEGTSLPWVDIGDIDGMDEEWLS